MRARIYRTTTTAITSLMYVSTLFSVHLDPKKHSVDSFLFPKPPLVPLAAKAFRVKKKLRNCQLRKKKQKQCKKNILLSKKVLLTGALAGPPLLVLGGVTAATVALNNVEPMEIYTPTPGSLKGETILITGGTTGLGLETAKRLAIGSPEHLIITARNDSKGRDAVDKIYAFLKEKMNDIDESDVNVSYRVLDLDDVQGVKNTVSDWLSSGSFPSQIDCLVNNAGVMNIPKKELTVDGIERQMASNHLGHFVLTKCLTPILSSDARIINVSSSAHQLAKATDGGMNFDYCWEGEPKYDGWRSYGQSKLANILFSKELQLRSDTAGLNWDVACLHPGAVNTDLWRQTLNKESYDKFQDLSTRIGDNLPEFLKEGADTLATKIGDLGIFLTVEQGATTSVWLAAGEYRNEEGNERTNARYFVDRKPQTLGSFAEDAAISEQLWKESEERSGITFDFTETSFIDDDSTTFQPKDTADTEVEENRIDEDKQNEDQINDDDDDSEDGKIDEEVADVEDSVDENKDGDTDESE